MTMNTSMYQNLSEESVRTMLLRIFAEKGYAPLGQKHYLTRAIHAAEKLLNKHSSDLFTYRWVTNVETEIRVMKTMREELQAQYKGNIPRAEYDQCLLFNQK